MTWWLVPVTLLLPDLSALGYQAGTRVGATLYNVAHATPLPVAVIGCGWWEHTPVGLALGLIWLAHIGLDRILG